MGIGFGFGVWGLSCCVSISLFFGYDPCGRELWACIGELGEAVARKRETTTAQTALGRQAGRWMEGGTYNYRINVFGTLWRRILTPLNQ